MLERNEVASLHKALAKEQDDHALTKKTNVALNQKYCDLDEKHKEFELQYSLLWKSTSHPSKAKDASMLGILNVITKSRLSFLFLITAQKMPNLSLMPLKPSCHPQHDMRDAVSNYAIALLNK